MPEEENLEEMHYVMVHVERIKKHMLTKLEGNVAGLEVNEEEDKIVLMGPDPMEDDDSVPEIYSKQNNDVNLPQSPQPANNPLLEDEDEQKKRNSPE